MIHVDPYEVQDRVDAFIIAIDKQDDQSWEALRPYLSPDVEFPMQDKVWHGPDELAAFFKEYMGPEKIGGGVWRPFVGGSLVHLHGDFYDNKVLIAMHFGLQIDPETMQITEIRMSPRHPTPDRNSIKSPLELGAIAPDFTLPAFKGEPESLNPGASKVTVVVFTCNHCPWALGWHDRIQNVIRDYEESPVRILQINSNDPEISAWDTTEISLKRVERGEFAGPYLLDEGQLVARAWGAGNTPEVFVLDSSGKVVYHGRPDGSSEDSSLRAHYLRDAIDAVLAGQEPALTYSEPEGCTIKYSAA